MTTNDAAERLRSVLTNSAQKHSLADLNAALAAERRATVERIRAALVPVEFADAEGYTIHDTHAILDAEAER